MWLLNLNDDIKVLCYKKTEVDCPVFPWVYASNDVRKNELKTPNKSR